MKTYDVEMVTRKLVNFQVEANSEAEAACLARAHWSGDLEPGVQEINLGNGWEEIEHAESTARKM